jgi:mRNA-degrading endonuclease RelE of RelBE toxin-antitoxin system
MYKVKWEDDALEFLSSLDPFVAEEIILRVKKHLASNPLQNGKPLFNQLAGL